MTSNRLSGTSEPLFFKSSGYWSSNVCGAILGGIGAGLLFLVVSGIIVWSAPTLKSVLFMGLVLVVVFGSLACFLVGNLIAAQPYAVLIERGRGLWLHAPLRKVYIPLEDVRDVRRSVQGFVVRLKRRHRLLTGFVIHRFFGSEREALAEAIREEIRRVP